MKKSKIIVPALGVLILSTAASISGTVAWFTANNTIAVSGLSMKAKAENGMVASSVASPSAAAHWLASVTAAHTGMIQVNQEEVAAEFLPTSTANGSAWYHSLASNIDASTSNGTYTTLSLSDSNSDGVYTDTAGEAYYLLNTIKFQASAPAQITGQDIYVQNLSVTGASNSADLDKALRIGFKWGDGNLVIYNGLEETGNGAVNTTSYTVGGTGGTAVTSRLASETTGNNNTSSEIASGVTLGAYTDQGTYATTLYVYCWFEGEDAHCKTTNITSTLDQLSIQFSIGTKVHDEPQQGNGD